MVQWPMNVLTRQAGDTRKLITHPVEITPRVNLKPDSNGKLLIVDRTKIKIKNVVLYPEVKEQGHFHFYCRDASGNYSMIGKRPSVTGKYIDILDKFTAQGRQMPPIPEETVIATELIWPDHPDTDVPTGLKECPNQLKVRGLGLAIYKGLNLHEENISYNNGRYLLDKVFPEKWLVEKFEPITFKGEMHSATMIEALLIRAKKYKIEGFVLKEKAYSGWWKLKGCREGDVFITGCKISTSDTQYGMVTAVTIGCMGPDGVINMGSVTGFTIDDKIRMTQAYRQETRFSNNFEKNYLGRVIRVVYQEIAGKGKLKHGFFDGWRDDKIDRDCGIDQFR